ncbi:uncharacterized protein BXZ73DRAFT_77813 [Epithele typhae]|uniref:uncharacterized protein n=1 Tax=Epithele typhae TaxID=378194 RepID=UPI0020078311|nr:uncharacterized protein BXZ73DRAFT_77813 [Epithele typhae]KAH9931132.1 hypothetical protein BXZ73DRAFT_77813 [Epithele typhae]
MKVSKGSVGAETEWDARQWGGRRTRVPGRGRGRAGGARAQAGRGVCGVGKGAREGRLASVGAHWRRERRRERRRGSGGDEERWQGAGGPPAGAHYYCRSSLGRQVENDYSRDQSAFGRPLPLPLVLFGPGWFLPASAPTPPPANPSSAQPARPPRRPPHAPQRRPSRPRRAPARTPAHVSTSAHISNFLHCTIDSLPRPHFSKPHPGRLAHALGPVPRVFHAALVSSALIAFRLSSQSRGCGPRATASSEWQPGRRLGTSTSGPHLPLPAVLTLRSRQVVPGRTLRWARLSTAGAPDVVAAEDGGLRERGTERGRHVVIGLAAAHSRGRNALGFLPARVPPAIHIHHTWLVVPEAVLLYKPRPTPRPKHRTPHAGGRIFPPPRPARAPPTVLRCLTAGDGHETARVRRAGCFCPGSGHVDFLVMAPACARLDVCRSTGRSIRAGDRCKPLLLGCRPSASAAHARARSRGSLAPEEGGRFTGLVARSTLALAPFGQERSSTPSPTWLHFTELARRFLGNALHPLFARGSSSQPMDFSSPLRPMVPAAAASTRTLPTAGVAAQWESCPSGTARHFAIRSPTQTRPQNGRTPLDFNGLADLPTASLIPLGSAQRSPSSAPRGTHKSHSSRVACTALHFAGRIFSCDRGKKPSSTPGSESRRNTRRPPLPPQPDKPRAHSVSARPGSLPNVSTPLFVRTRGRPLVPTLTQSGTTDPRRRPHPITHLLTGRPAPQHDRAGGGGDDARSRNAELRRDLRPPRAAACAVCVAERAPHAAAHARFGGRVPGHETFSQARRGVGGRAGGRRASGGLKASAAVWPPFRLVLPRAPARLATAPAEQGPPKLKSERSNAAGERLAPERRPRARALSGSLWPLPPSVHPSSATAVPGSWGRPRRSSPSAAGVGRSEAGPRGFTCANLADRRGNEISHAKGRASISGPRRGVVAVPPVPPARSRKNVAHAPEIEDSPRGAREEGQPPARDKAQGKQPRASPLTQVDVRV